MTKTPILMWFRRDLRLHDHDALCAAVATGHPVIPVFIRDETVDALGAAAKLRLGLSIEALDRDLSALGSRLILRSGPALSVLRDLIDQTGASGVHWTRYYAPKHIARDMAVKAALKADGIAVQSHGGQTIFEPWDVKTGQGDFYKVYSPFWRNVAQRDVAAVRPAPTQIPAPADWPTSEALADWRLWADVRRGADILTAHQSPGEVLALARLDDFLDRRIMGYAALRNAPAEPATSGLSEHLTYGEISPRVIWHAAQRAMIEGASGAETFLKEIVWREFAWHLFYHAPAMDRENWRDGWDAFPWQTDISPEIAAWQQARTGIPIVDAGLREAYVTGRMHNRVRMIVASYLTKHLMGHWRVGLDWFQDILTDWDPAANAMGWQWVAGSGPDAAPYFRVFNPVTQAAKFDPKSKYLDRWLVRDHHAPTDVAKAYFDMVPRQWNLSPKDPYPDPIVALDVGRDRALAAYAALRSGT